MIEDGLLYHIYTLWIPDDANLKRTILESEHNNKVVSYMGVARTSDLIRKNFWWLGIDQKIRNYIRTYPKYQ